jgi:hypothetical protein
MHAALGGLLSRLPQIRLWGRAAGLPLCRFLVL